MRSARPVRAALALVIAVLGMGEWGGAPAHAVPAAPAARPAPPAPKLVVDGRRVEVSPPPVIVSGRTMVPFRVVFTTLGARVEWDGETKTVTASRGDRWVRVRIGQRLACLASGCMEAALMDVPPEIRDDRTFIPLRFVATALGAAVRWDAAARTVYVDTGSGARSDAAGPAVRITSPASPAIAGPAELRVAVTGSLPAGPAEVRFLLLDPETGRGPVIARGTDVTGTYAWLPDPAHEGLRLLAAVVCDRAGGFLAGDVIPVRLAVRPDVTLAGVTPGQEVAGPVDLGVRAGFLATHVRYEVVDPETGAAVALGDGDPEGSFRWTPRLEHNGYRTVRATVYDRLGRPYPAAEVPVVVSVPRRLALTGVAAGDAIARPVTLGVTANFTVRAVRYVLRDPATGAEEELARYGGAGRHRWLPAPSQAGSRMVLAVVTDDQGQEQATAPVPIAVRGEPALFLETVGPNQVLAGEVRLRALANVPLARLEYRLVDPRTGESRTIAAGSDAGTALTWKPAAGDAGSWQVRAVGLTPAGEEVASEPVPVRVHAGPLYGPQPVVPKERFLDFASALARPAQRRTGMSAALQVAQAILESGWGQSVPVDKYTGVVSYNLFGIKGQGPAGSVISSTWEEYKGVSYRVDAPFRAYRDAAESWDDHKRLLLTAKRYGPFRAVMHDAVRGAWALYRAGYATDSRYPVKLIDLMNRYGLYSLDEWEP